MTLGLSSRAERRRHRRITTLLESDRGFRQSYLNINRMRQDVEPTYTESYDSETFHLRRQHADMTYDNLRLQNELCSCRDEVQTARDQNDQCRRLLALLQSQLAPLPRGEAEMSKRFEVIGEQLAGMDVGSCYFLNILGSEFC